MPKIYRNCELHGETISGQYSFNHEAGWINFRGDRKLMLIREAFDVQPRQMYAMQDGYGSVGFIPPQGMDWSGIRDSSDEAIERMYAFAKTVIDEDRWLADILTSGDEDGPEPDGYRMSEGGIVPTSR